MWWLHLLAHPRFSPRETVRHLGNGRYSLTMWTDDDYAGTRGRFGTGALVERLVRALGGDVPYLRPVVQRWLRARDEVDAMLAVERLRRFVAYNSGPALIFSN